MIREHLRDALRIGCGQVAAALGALAGVRLLTELLPPAAFGQLTLLTGAIALLISVCVNPFAQGILYSYSAARNQDEKAMLRAAMQRAISRLSPAVLTLGVVVSVLATVADWAAPGALLLLWLLAPVEALRLFNLSVLSAARRHDRYASWSALDAWLRPICAAMAIMVFGATADAALAGYCVAALLLLVSLGRGVLPPRADAAAAPAVAERATQLWHYALPLIPLGLIGWANGLGDRFLIGGMLSLADAGIYAAVYGLASRPMLMISGALELQMRPLYQAAVSGAHLQAARRALRSWSLALLAIGLLVTIALSLLARPLAELLLGEPYRAPAVTLVPWIAAGYLLQALGQVAERVCYAHGDTRAVLWTQSAAALTAMVSIAVGIELAGLRGAAMAVPAYLGVGAGIAWWFARRSRVVPPVAMTVPAA